MDKILLPVSSAPMLGQSLLEPGTAVNYMPKVLGVGGGGGSVPLDLRSRAPRGMEAC